MYKLQWQNMSNKLSEEGRSSFTENNLNEEKQSTMKRINVDKDRISLNKMGITDISFPHNRTL